MYIRMASGQVCVGTHHFSGAGGRVTFLKARKTLPLSHSTVCSDYSSSVRSVDRESSLKVCKNT